MCVDSIPAGMVQVMTAVGLLDRITSGLNGYPRPGIRKGTPGDPAGPGGEKNKS
jgi:hypothetical protein